MESDTIKLADDSEVTLMLARTLTLECPRGQTGHETITQRGADAAAGGAAGDPERQAAAEGRADAGPAQRAVRVDPARRDAGGRRRRRCRRPTRASPSRGPSWTSGPTRSADLIETLDLLYDAFGQKRFGKEWEAELPGMQKWLKREERRAA